MDIIEMTRQLGKAIQQDERYINLLAANAANDNNAELQDEIRRFSDLRDQMNQEMMNPDKDSAQLSEMETQLRAIYAQVMNTTEMAAYSNAKQEMDSLLTFISQIITASANGQNPDEVEYQEACSGSCSSCSGCN